MKDFGRREFIEGVGLVTAFGLFGCRTAPTGEPPCVRFGLVTDLHYADIPVSEWGEGQYHRLSKGRLEEAVKVFNAHKLDFAVELGDFKDLMTVNGLPSRELTSRFADEIEGAFARFRGPRYHVLGNHDHDVLNKEEILAHFPSTGVPAAASHYAFERGGITFVVLDANYNADGTPYTGTPVNWRWQVSYLPPDQIAWLERTLAAAQGKAVVFVHQLLDADASVPHRVRNADDVMRVLERSGKVLGVFQGHEHAGRFSTVNGINYYTLRAMVSGREANSYAEVAITANGSVSVTGFAKAASQTWTRVSRGQVR